ncbi:sensor histidine kinase [Streptantibioticus ferralitis]|uniref:histidine kinase n=1 Tax=Streptantibioticus ferralitis TaxID=236510 RepID=A0ABT5ZA05_9ACTN|nr:histidine kinase [Streptantibioticus ferralitis]MDF2260659.1 histidine kinase [Streptantibioticus ferralitis]
MQRLYDFFRRHPTMVDGFWAFVLLGLSALQIVSQSNELEIPPAVALSLVVALRRRAPEKMLLLAIATGIAQLVFQITPTPGNFAMLVIVYTVASVGARWARRLALLGSLSAAGLYELRWPSGAETTWGHMVTAVFMTIPFALAWVIGDSLRTRRAYYAQLEERAERLQREREAQAKAAVAAERARIARELHDVVAHNVSVMVVQADGAAYVLDASPDQAKQALSTISQTGRLALAEMRRLLGLLRASDDSGGEYVPQPGVDQLGDLIDQVRGAGLPVDFAVDGTPRPLSSGVELTAYRIVQEALTNTRKHGGPDARAAVHITYGDSELQMLIEDDGRGAQHELYEEGGADGLGQGLIGMRERIAMVGGTLDTGPRPGGGFRISAALPLKPGR